MNELVRDERTLRLPAGLPGGVYAVQAVVRGPAGETHEVVGEVTLAGAPAALPAAGAPAGQFHDDIRLIAKTLEGIGPDGAVQPGKPITVDLDWQALKRSADDYALRVRLVGPGDRVVAEDRAVPRNGFVPMSVWLPGDREHTRHRLTAPADAPPGRYVVQVGFEPYRTRPSLVTLENVAQIGPLKVLEPQREPRPAQPLAARFGGDVDLLGYDFRDEGETLVLYWRAARKPSADFTRFVHLMAGSRVVGQVDSAPRDYPTSLWSAGEYVTEEIELPEAPGAASIRLGWYRPETGQRLTTDTGADSVDIPLTGHHGGT